MFKYKIDKEFGILKHMRLPGNPRLLPFVNAILRLMQPHSDQFIKVTKYRIWMNTKKTVTIYLLEPKETKIENGKDKKIMPCLLDIHGGGFMMKASKAHVDRAKEYARKLSCKVVMPDYHLIPDNPYPVSLQECFATYQWIMEHADRLGIDRHHLAVLGDSAGGNLAVAVTMMVRDQKLILPRILLLLYPVLDRRMKTESMKKYTDTPVWDANLCQLMWKLYLGNGEIEKIEYASPAEAEDFNNMPPIYLEVAEFDSLRDEGLEFAEKLKSKGIMVEAAEIKRAVHGYDTVTKSKIVKRLMERRLVRLSEAFLEE